MYVQYIFWFNKKDRQVKAELIEVKIYNKFSNYSYTRFKFDFLHFLYFFLIDRWFDFCKLTIKKICENSIKFSDLR